MSVDRSAIVDHRKSSARSSFFVPVRAVSESGMFNVAFCFIPVTSCENLQGLVIISIIPKFKVRVVVAYYIFIAADNIRPEKVEPGFLSILDEVSGMSEIGAGKLATSENEQQSSSQSLG